MRSPFENLAVSAALVLALAACKPSSQTPAPSAAGSAAEPAAGAAPASHPGAQLPLAVAEVPPPGSLGRAPNWSLKDLNGTTVSLDQFKGKVVVLDFWATWCVPCRSEIPGYVALQKKYGGDGLVVVGASVDSEGPGVVKKFVDRQGVSYLIVMADDKVQQDFGGIDAIPTTFIIDRQGFIRDKKVGALPTAEFESRLLKVLKPSESGT